jgi:manganese-transporting P-type ATPase
VRSFKQAGETALFCGDGTNDMAALGEADVGVALLTGFSLANTEKAGLSAPVTAETSDDVEEGVQIGDASAAAPFTAKRPSIQSVLGILR